MKNEIKIIKKIDRLRKPEPAPAKEKSGKREQSHDAINTITGWVREIQGRRTVDPKLAFHNLFSDPLVGAS